MPSRDDIRSLSTEQRWIPPSTVRRDALTPESRNDLIFRKVRGILNKLTPEKFAKLSNDLLNVELNSDVILKGVIFLVRYQLDDCSLLRIEPRSSTCCIKRKNYALDVLDL